ncbi:hypothetical protein [Adlercreutzia sp. ZJ242]|uniref:hypothetical protein n=1 Tax=Adlercreutzia sp. ZJ242 TaxID=2709409 RepID=UPI0013EE18F7|nr:hypothetical protein [Adlercreutzia sp. ZJ242]
MEMAWRADMRIGAQRKRDVDERLRKLDDLHAVQQRVIAFYAERGIAHDPLPSTLDDRELYEEALVERSGERGLL